MSTTTIAKHWTFDSAHRLPNVAAGHKCGRMHGHTYRLTVRLARAYAELPEDGEEAGMVMDYDRLGAVVAPLLADLDHRVLNDIPGLMNPTTEVLARWIWRRLVGRVPFLHEIEVHESSTTSCVYRE